jgi:hypothetical protein
MNKKFKDNGYYLARDFFDPLAINLLSTYFDIKYKNITYNEQTLKAASYDTVSSGQVTDSFTFYCDPFIESIHYNYGQKVSNTVGLNLYPTYSYTRIYEKDACLIPHLDRPSCEISGTAPISISDTNPSTIYVSNYKTITTDNGVVERMSLDEVMSRGDYTEVNLYPGDILFYTGCERYHWRKPLKSDLLVQFFIHFVEKNEKNERWVYDQRPFLGFDRSMNTI